LKKDRSEIGGCKFLKRYMPQNFIEIVNRSESGHSWHARHTGHGAGSGHLRSGSVSALHLGEEVGGFDDLLLEFSVVGQVELSLFERQVDEHTSNLRSKSLASELADEIEDGVTNVLLEMRVVSLDGRDDLGSLGVESSGGRVLRRSHVHGLLADVSVGELNGILLLLHGSLALVSVLSHWLLHLLIHVVHGASGVVALTLRSALLVVSLSLVSTLVVSVVSLLATLSASAHLLESVLSLLGKGLQELSDLVVEFVSGGDVLPVVLGVVKLSELLEAKLILSLFIRDLSELLELVMADLELSLVVESVVAELQSLLSLVGSLEAHEGVSFLGLVNGEHLDALDLSVLGEDTHNILVGELGVKVLDVEVASLLGVLVFDSLTEELFLSSGGSKGGLNVKDLTVTHVSSVEGLNSFEGLLGSVLVIVLVF